MRLRKFMACICLFGIYHITINECPIQRESIDRYAGRELIEIKPRIKHSIWLIDAWAFN